MCRRRLKNFLACNKNQSRTQRWKNFPAAAKIRNPATQGWHLPPHANPWPPHGHGLVKWINLCTGKIELSSILQRLGFSSTEMAENLSLATKIKKIKSLPKSSQIWQIATVLLLRGAICLPMPPHGYGPAPPMNYVAYCITVFYTRLVFHKAAFIFISWEFPLLNDNSNCYFYWIKFQ